MLSRIRLIMVLATAFGLVSAPPSAAGQGVSATPASDWVADGAVRAIAAGGPTVFLAGEFARIAPKTGPLVAIDAATGAPVPGMPRVAGGNIRAIIPDGSGGYVLAGSFQSIGGVARPGLARISSAGAVDPVFVPSGFDEVSDAALVGMRLFVHTSSSTEVLNLTTGQPIAWPALSLLNGSLFAGINGSIVVSRQFTGGGGDGNFFIVCLDAITGQERWRFTTTEELRQVAIDGSYGYFVIDDLFVNHSSDVWRVDLATGAVERLVQTSGSCYKLPCRIERLTAVQGRLFIGGSFQIVNGQPRAGFAVVDAISGALLAWTRPAIPGYAMDSVYAGHGYVLARYDRYDHASARTMLLLALNSDTGADTGFRAYLIDGSSLSIAAEPDRLIAGGSFSGAGGEARRGLAQVAWPSGAPTTWQSNHFLSGPMSLARAGRRLFVAEYQSLFEVDAITGARGPWTIVFDEPVEDLAISGNRLLVGGIFTRVSWLGDRGAFDRARVAAFDISAGTPVLESWMPLAAPDAFGFGVFRLHVLPGAILAETRAETPPHAAGVVLLHAATGAVLPFTPPPGLTGLAVADDRVWMTSALGLTAYDFSGRQIPLPPYQKGPLRLEAVAGDWLYVTAFPGAIPPTWNAYNSYTAAWVPWTPEGVSVSISFKWRAMDDLGLALIDTGLKNGFTFFSRRPAPAAVTGLRGTASNLHVQLDWDAVPDAVGYEIEAGSGPGASNLAIIDTRSTATSFAADAPPGRYYVRVRARGDGGRGAPSGDLQVALGAGACAGPPGAPSAFAIAQTGRTVSLTWTAPAGPAPVWRFVLQVGTLPGATNLAAIDLGLATTVAGPVPPGSYFARISAENACGASSPSNEIHVVIP